MLRPQHIGQGSSHRLAAERESAVRRMGLAGLRRRMRMMRRARPRHRRLPDMSKPVRHLLAFWLVLVLAAGLVALDRRYPQARGWVAETAARGWRAGTAAAGELLPGLVSWAQADGRLGEEALRQGLPAAVWEAGTQVPQVSDWRRDVRTVVYVLTRYDLHSPAALLEAGLPGLAGYTAARSGEAQATAAGSPPRGLVTIAGTEDGLGMSPGLPSPLADTPAAWPPLPAAPGPPAAPAVTTVPPEASSSDALSAAGPEPAHEPSLSGPLGGSGSPIGAPGPPDAAQPVASGAGRSAPVSAEDWRDRLRTVQWGEGCRILIYHTHTSETYRTGSFAPSRADAYHIWNTTETGIVAVGRALARRLESGYGIPTCHAVDVHDWPSHPRAYIESRATVQEMLARNPRVELVLDVHRDAPEGLVATIGGQRVAQVALVVGTNARMHPRWQENLAFARELGQRLTVRYPGLFRRVIERPDARLNQDLHPRAVLLEIGSYHNHLDEALLAAELVADVLAETLAGILADGDAAGARGTR